MKTKPAVRWPLIFEYLGTVIIVLACTTSNEIPITSITTATTTAIPTEQPALRLEGGAIKAKDENDHWIPVTGESTFELFGYLESTDPWKVSGNTFAVRDTTHIADELKAWDRVLVKGVILEDATWLAKSIEPAEEQVDPVLILTGKVNSIDPWIVSGIPLHATDSTTITGNITPDMIVRVEILLMKGGMWDVINIAPLSHFTEIPGCITVTAMVVSVDGNKVQFAGWPAITLDKDVKIENESEQEATLAANQSVLVVICAAEGDQFKITKIVILKTDEIDNVANNEKVLICHNPEKKGGGHTIGVSAAGVPAHLAHGDTQGPCP